MYNLISKQSSNLKPESLPMVLNFNGDMDISVHCAYIFPKKIILNNWCQNCAKNILANTNIRSHQGLLNETQFEKN